MILYQLYNSTYVLLYWNSFSVTPCLFSNHTTPIKSDQGESFPQLLLHHLHLIVLAVVLVVFFRRWCILGTSSEPPTQIPRVCCLSYPVKVYRQFHHARNPKSTSQSKSCLISKRGDSICNTISHHHLTRFKHWSGFFPRYPLVALESELSNIASRVCS